MKIHLNLVPAVLFLAGCGGTDFNSGAGLGNSGGAGGEAVEAGATGGAGGAVTSGTGGAIAVTGGSGGALGGSGGVAMGGQAGSGGFGGAATGGQTGSGGVLGGAGSGGAAGACNPPVVTSASLPQQVVLDSYVGKVSTINGDICLTCQHSPCTTCQLNWGIVTPGAGLTFTSQASLAQCTPMPMNMGPCGSDLSQSSCTTWTPVVYGTFTFQLQPKPDGSGYSAVIGNVSVTGSTLTTDNGTCDATLYRAAYGSTDYMTSFIVAEKDALLATAWPCGQ